jgi:elongation factor Ts|tara:strand:+ start:875 stop:1468 length:594 start_codon:yes stop_codon:yes gene_type:complete
VNVKLVKELREKTGAGMMDCKQALVKSSGDMEKAVDFLRKSGIAKAGKKVSRDAKEGMVYSYIHQGNRLGVLLEIGCETDFVAKTDGFQDLAHNISMQIAATNPIALSREKVPQKVINREKEIYSEQAKSSGKPDNIIKKMVEGKLNKFYQENCLLEQNFIKDPDKILQDIITETIATLGENIIVNRYIRFAIGEEA